MTDDPDATLEKLRLLNAEVKDRLGRQSESSSKIDIKATTMLGFSVALGAFVGLQSPLGWWRLIALAFVVAACFFAWQAMGVKDYTDVPEPGPIFVEGFVEDDRTEMDVLGILIAARVAAFVKNGAEHQKKADAWQHCIIALTLAATATLVFVLVIGVDANAQ